jgi:hypothetical protein
MRRPLRTLACAWSLVIVLGAGVWYVADPPGYMGQQLKPIRSDGLGYHAWTQAIAYGDFSFCHYSGLDLVAAISARRGRNRCTNKFSPGLAILRLPVMFWLVKRGNTDLVVSAAEDTASQWLALVALAVTCGFILGTALGLGVRPLVANLVLLVAVFGTGMFHYATFDGSFTHVYSAALLAALLWLGVRAARAGRAPPIIAVALLAFFIALVRQPNVVVLVVLLGAWLIWRVRPLPAEKRVAAAVRVAAPVLAGIGAALLLQLAYNRWSSGHWMLSSYGQEELNPVLLHERSVLLSYDRGLFTWYPAVLGLLAVAVVVRRSRGWGLTALGAVAALTLVYGSWHSWPLGAGFGHRGFVEVVPLVALAGAYALDGLRARVAVPVFVALALCTFATVELMRGYWRATVPNAGTRSTQYWSNVTGRDSLLP